MFPYNLHHVRTITPFPSTWDKTRELGSHLSAARCRVGTLGSASSPRSTSRAAPVLPECANAATPSAAYRSHKCNVDTRTVFSAKLPRSFELVSDTHTHISKPQFQQLAALQTRKQEDFPRQLGSDDIQWNKPKTLLSRLCLNCLQGLTQSIKYRCRCSRAADFFFFCLGFVFQVIFSGELQPADLAADSWPVPGTTLL